MDFIIDDYGLPHGDVGGIDYIRGEVSGLLEKVCPTSAEAWGDEPALREVIVAHLYRDHGLSEHFQAGEIATILEVDNLYRQLLGKEEQIGVIYQRHEYQPD